MKAMSMQAPTICPRDSRSGNTLDSVGKTLDVAGVQTFYTIRRIDRCYIELSQTYRHQTYRHHAV